MSETWVDDVLNFWFKEMTPEQWFGGGEGLDDRIRSRFIDLYQELKSTISVGEVDDARTALAAIILFDQFPRNMFRGTGAAFGTDDLALGIARRAIDRQFDDEVAPEAKSFVYMPFMHSEVLADQERCVDLFKTLDAEEGLKYAIEHRDIVAQFGRFPHRNKPLGRESTDAEQAFLQSHAGYGQ